MHIDKTVTQNALFAVMQAGDILILSEGVQDDLSFFREDRRAECGIIFPPAVKQPQLPARRVCPSHPAE